MPELPPQITTLEDHMAWAAYLSFQATSPDEDAGFDYAQFKTERVRWNAVANNVVQAAADFIAEIRAKAAKFDLLVDPDMLCDFCGITKRNAVEHGLTYCAPPFKSQPHTWTGEHLYHVRQAKDLPETL